MLRIDIPSEDNSGLTFTELKKFEVPEPLSGFNPEVNDKVIMQFEDEQDAIDYAHDLDEYAESIKDHGSPVYLIIRKIINAISNDDFVQSYIRG